MSGPPSVGEFLRAGEGTDHAPGVYRVVGTPDDRVTLLRVTDADGRRAHTGELTSVHEADLDGFEPAEDPGGGSLTGVGESVYWTLRTFAASLAANPIATAVALAALALGEFGGDLLSLSDAVAGALVVAGAFGLAYVGSGRR